MCHAYQVHVPRANAAPAAPAAFLDEPSADGQQVPAGDMHVAHTVTCQDLSRQHLLAGKLIWQALPQAVCCTGCCPYEPATYSLRVMVDILNATAACSVTDRSCALCWGVTRQHHEVIRALLRITHAHTESTHTAGSVPGAV
jgi:hypothetical protein